MTEILKLKGITAADLDRVAASLASGGLACLPSDTVYGLACLPQAPGALGHVYEVKGRQPDKPIALVFGRVGDIFDILPDLPERIRKVMLTLLPGAVTAVVPASAAEKESLGMAELKGLGVRVIPPPLDKLYQHLPGPLAVTSANLSGQPDTCDAGAIPDEVRQACDFIIDAGRCGGGVPSTVVDLRPIRGGGLVAILREGALPRAEVERRVESCGC